MDASGYLRRQGWLGDGHSLDHTGKGIKKPLLVSKKVDVLGVGLNKHAAVSDQWWLRAYDQGLKDLGSGKTNLLGQVQRHGHKNGGLYGRFVKGEGAPGTIGTETPNSDLTPEESTAQPASASDSDTSASAGMGRDKRKRAADEGDEPARVYKKIKGPKNAKQLERAREHREAGVGKYGPNPTPKQLAHKMSKTEHRKMRAAERAAKAEQKASQAGSGPGSVAQKKSKKVKVIHGATPPGSRADVDIEQNKLDLYRATKRGMTLPDYRRALAAIEVVPPRPEKRVVSESKLREYTTRAKEKGISVDEYVQRREEKYAAKQAEKLSRLTAKTAPDTAAGTQGEAAAVPCTSLVETKSRAGDLTFVADTVGDVSLVKPSKKHKRGKKKKAGDAEKSAAGST
ncbi:hypothetical protein LTR53_007491 [Teratosphaeriaceae sp. CCFEE 6253]|nr:hypothetical protein LTR53_007491 [Teratosphaeriaceae sp. CCFEE 6253]